MKKESYVKNLLVKNVRMNISEDSDISNFPVHAIMGIGAYYSKMLASKKLFVINDLANVEVGTLSIPKVSPLLLTKWILAAKLIHVILIQKRDLPSKIIFAGMAAAGKTSIILSVRNQYGNQIVSIPPTMGAVPETISILGLPLLIWDFGGQKGFRNMHLRVARNFKDLRLLFYILDAEDTEQFPVALTYLNQICKKIHQMGSSPQISVFLHKIDLVSEQERERIAKWKNEIKSVENIKDLPVVFFETTVIDRHSLLNAFAYSLRSVSPAPQALAAVFEEFGNQRLQADCVLLYSSLGLLVASWNKEEFDFSDELEKDILSTLYIKLNEPDKHTWFTGIGNEDIGLVPLTFSGELAYFIVINPKSSKTDLEEDLESIREEVEIWLNAYSHRLP